MNSIDSSISFEQAAVIGGIAIAWGVMTPTSALGSLATVVSGLIGSALIYVPSKLASERYDQLSHRASTPLILDPKTKLYESKFNEAFSRIQMHPQYDFFNQTIHKGEALQFLKKTIEAGICFGSTVNILKGLNKSPTNSSFQLLKSIDYTDILYEQLLHFMQCSFQVTVSNVQRDLTKAKIRNSTMEWDKELGRPIIVHKLPTKEMEQLETTALGLKKIIADLQKESIPWEEISNTPFNATENIKTWKTTLETLMASQGFSPDTPIFGRIEICGDENDKKQPGYKGGHVISFRYTPNQFGFYDTISRYDGGFYEFNNKTEFFQALKTQLLDDLRKVKNIQVAFFIKKQNLQD